MQLDTGVHPMWIAMLALYTLATVIASFLLIARRKYVMIKVRITKLLALQVLIGFIMVVMICIRESMRHSFPCWAYVVIMNMFTPLYFLPLFYQAMFADHISNHTTVNMRSGYVSTFLENLRRKNGLFAICCGVLLSMHIVLIAIQLFYASENDTLSHGCAWNTNIEYTCMAIVSGIYACAFGYVSIWMLRNSRERYDIKNDLRIAFAWCLVWGTLFFVFNLTPPLWSVEEYVPFSVCIYIMLFGLLIYLVIRPCVLAPRPEYETQLTNALVQGRQRYESMSDYMQDKQALESLTSWCTKYNLGTVDVDMFVLTYNFYEKLRNHYKRVHMINDTEINPMRTSLEKIVEYMDKEMQIDGEELRKFINIGQEAAIKTILKSFYGLPTHVQFAPYLEAVTHICQSRVLDLYIQSEEFRVLYENKKGDMEVARNTGAALKEHYQEELVSMDDDSLV